MFASVTNAFHDVLLTQIKPESKCYDSAR